VVHEAAVHDVAHTVKHAKLDHGPSASTHRSSGPIPREQVPAGTSKNAASVPVKEPVQSTPEPPPAGQDRSPYAPGHAPLRIPEAPTVIRG
jgi:hypothetical protein